MGRFRAVEVVTPTQIRLANSSGGSLIEYSSSTSGSQYVLTARTGCHGAYIHAFLYINVGGTGKSYTSADPSPDCNY